MSLIIPRFGFTRYADNLDPAAPLFGGQVLTAGATANTDGTEITSISSLAFDACLLLIDINQFVSNGSASSTLVDILYDPAGGTSWSELASDLVGGQTALAGCSYQFPLWIPAGSSIGARCRSVVGSNSGNITIAVAGEPSRPDMWWCGTKIESIGIDAANSSGTIVTPGTNAFGSWTNIGSPSTRDHGFVAFGCNGGGSSMAANNWLYELGISGIPIPVSRFTVTSTTGEFTSMIMLPGSLCNSKAGSQYQARGSTSSGTTALQVAVYGVY